MERGEMEIGNGAVKWRTRTSVMLGGAVRVREQPWGTPRSESKTSEIANRES